MEVNTFHPIFFGYFIADWLLCNFAAVSFHTTKLSQISEGRRHRPPTTVGVRVAEWLLSCGIKISAALDFVLSQSICVTDKQTDRQTEVQQQYRALHCMQSPGKNWCNLLGICVMVRVHVIKFWWHLTLTFKAISVKFKFCYLELMIAGTACTLLVHTTLLYHALSGE